MGSTIKHQQQRSQRHDLTLRPDLKKKGISFIWAVVLNGVIILSDSRIKFKKNCLLFSWLSLICFYFPAKQLLTILQAVLLLFSHACFHSTLQ